MTRLFAGLVLFSVDAIRVSVSRFSPNTPLSEIANIPDICPAFCARQNLPFIQRLSAAGSLGGADRRVSDRKRAKLPTLQSIFLHQPPQHRDQGKARDPAEQDFKPHRPAQDNTEQQIRSRRVFDDGCPIAILLQIDQRKYKVERIDKGLKSRIFGGHFATFSPLLLAWLPSMPEADANPGR
jgi:hypothetical protein